MRSEIKLAILLIFLIAGCSCAEQQHDADSRDVLALPELGIQHRVNGLPFLKENNYELLRIRKTDFPRVSQAVRYNAKAPSGGRISFNTASTSMFVNAVGGNYSVYVNDRFLANAHGPSAFHLPGTGKKQVVLYMAIQTTFRINKIELSKHSTNNDGLRKADPIVYYGSSITAGLNANEPGAMYPSVVSRLNKYDLVNLGISGNGVGEPEMADITSSIKGSLYVLDFWANPATATYDARLIPFIKIIRQKRPNTPILVTTPILNTTPQLLIENKQKRSIVYRRVNEALRMGLGPIHIHDFEGVLQHDDLADRRHPTSRGHAKMANSINKTICNILGC